MREKKTVIIKAKRSRDWAFCDSPMRQTIYFGTAGNSQNLMNHRSKQIMQISQFLFDSVKVVMCEL